MTFNDLAKDSRFLINAKDTQDLKNVLYGLIYF